MAASRWPVRTSAVLVLAGMLLVLPGCGTPRPDPGTLTPGTCFQTTPIRYRWSTRTYLLHIPQNYHEQKAWPFVLALHGAFGTAGTMERQSGFSELADREGFVVAYPNGIGLFGYLQHWNAGHCCGLAEMDGVDDVGFLRYVIRDVARRVRLDPQRLYVVGYSNGAMLAYRFASEHSGSIAAVGVVAGSIGSSKGAPQRGVIRWGPQGRGDAACRIGPPKIPVPLIAIHGRDDPTIPLAGGPGLRSGPRHYVPVVDSAALWARYCRCPIAPEVADDPAADRCTMTWRDDREEPWVVLHILDHWKHAWPGISAAGRLPPDPPPTRRSGRERPFGPRAGVKMFETSQVVWDFFCSRTPQYSRRQ